MAKRSKRAKKAVGKVGESTLADDLRDAISFAGQSVDAISKGSGVSITTITKFADGVDVKLLTASKLAAHFGMRLTPLFPQVSVEQLESSVNAVRQSKPARKGKKHRES